MTSPSTPRPDGITRVTRHAISIAAPSDLAYQLLVDIDGWPALFGPTVHAELLTQHAEEQHLRLWALAHGSIRRWESSRTLDSARRRIDFHQTRPAEPLQAMSGAWEVVAGGQHSCVVALHHQFTVGSEHDAMLVETAVEHNSTAELRALAARAELQHRRTGLVRSFSDAVDLHGCAPDRVWDFLWDAGRWADRLPHVAAIEVEHQADGQLLTMTTRAPDGTEHITRSARIALPGRLLYKQTDFPPIMTAHTGAWTIEPTTTGLRLIAQHTVAINPDRIEDVLGADTSIAEAHSAVRAALTRNSRVTLEHARDAGRGATHGTDGKEAAA